MSVTSNLQSGATERIHGAQWAVLVLMRLAIGWHFLYEGVTKLFDPDWTAAGFLASTKWLFAEYFHQVAATPSALAVVDFLNAWGLTAIGLGLFFGLLTRTACVAGAGLLALYYIANPPLIGLGSSVVSEGSYVWIDKNLVEMTALVALAFFPTGQVFGLDRLFLAWRLRRLEQSGALYVNMSEPSKGGQSGRSAPVHQPLVGPMRVRRDLLKGLGALPLFGVFAYAVLRKRQWDSYEERHLLAATEDTDATSGATIKTFNFSRLKDLQGTIPTAKIGDLELSRMILGGNLIGGWAHARDLIYVSKLVKAYHHDRKVFETLRLAEHCGINTILCNPVLARVINKYWRQEKGQIQFISDIAFQGDALKGIEVSVQAGAHACYLQGGLADPMVMRKQYTEIREILAAIRKHGLPAGIGAHKLETVQGCVEAGIQPDFWVKTLHETNYPTADLAPEYDNIWCRHPEETIAFMNDLPEPWIAFKILAAGALKPEDAFRYAFKNGADFICVGMYDFQIVDDANIALSALASAQDRRRPWRA